MSMFITTYSMELERDFYANMIFQFHAFALLSFVLLLDYLLTYLLHGAESFLRS